jgi:hypothetical protein
MKACNLYSIHNQEDVAMTLEDAIADLTTRIKIASPNAVMRVKRRSAEEATIRVYAPVEDESAIKAAA